MKKEKRTRVVKDVVLPIRLDKELLESIGFWADFEGIDRLAFCRRAIEGYITDLNAEADEDIRDRYIEGMIDEEVAKKDLEILKIPEDWKQARKDFLISRKDFLVSTANKKER